MCKSNSGVADLQCTLLIRSRAQKVTRQIVLKELVPVLSLSILLDGETWKQVR
jgi:hypothetical protein